jgi:V/A-type H+-transporting ATPase subunit I
MQGSDLIMAVANMKLVNIVGRLNNFDEVVQNCCIKGNFHPEFSSLAVENVEEFVPIEDENPYEHATQKAVDIGVHSDIPLRYSSFDSLGMPFEEMSDYIDKAENDLGVLNGKATDLAQTAARYEQVLKSLTHLKDLNISLDDLFGCKNIIFRFGRLPKDGYYKINDDEEYDNRLFFALQEDELFFWGFYVAKVEDEHEAEEFYASLYFERIHIVEGVQGTPQEAQESVSVQLRTTIEALNAARAAVKKYWSENEATFLKVYSNVRYLHDSFDLRKYAAKYSDSFYIFGWVTENDIESFSRQFERFPGVDCIVETTEDAEDVTPPTSLINNNAVKPFENFIGMYGLPSYNEIDPTPFMAISYSIIFGLMFGDLGQGFVILLIAIFMKYKKMFLGDIMIRCSLFSMLFGTLYNSIFGFDGILPFTVLPVHDQKNLNTVLLLSVGFGMFLILTCMVLNIINGIRQHNIEKFLFNQNGLSGFIFYASVVTAAVLMMIFNKNIITPIFISILIIIPLLIIGFKEPLSALCERKKDWIPKNKGEFAILTFFELFEIVLSFVSNTISYIRIGAFILSHSAMMIAVFTIAKMTGNGSPAVIIFGNIFVIALEGLVVGIQGLRLQFYEIFSRFFEGNGKPYEPVSVKYDV